MSFPNNKKDLTRIAEDRNIQKFDYKEFADIEPVAEGGFGSVNRAYSKILEKKVALKCLHDENHLNWKMKIKMAQDIANGLYYMHKANIIHRDLHSKNVLVHKGKLLIADLGLSKPLDSNSNSITGGILGALFWELSSGILPFNNFLSFEIYKFIISDKREVPINETPVDYINIYSNAWKDNPEQRPTIENIRDSLENIQFENIYNNSNKSSQYIQVEIYANNQLNKLKSMGSYSKDYLSIESNNQISFGDSINFANLKISVLEKSSTLFFNSYDQEWLNNELKKYEYNAFENIKNISENIKNATLMNGKIKVTLKSIVVNYIKLFINKLKKHLNVNSHENIIEFNGISQKDVHHELKNKLCIARFASS
ncbi:hypothetical protein Glove_166g251 [Diversispora epigaea]|uniref:Protein kinase domain-containing protein n=1 Tax=Diversispora epigaea TaxID=1348612 RepID=A0A397J019_9GLOM|nr:hypothetical protein Glove_166g251 [Diversispora epigaea]